MSERESDECAKVSEGEVCVRVCSLEEFASTKPQGEYPE